MHDADEYKYNTLEDKGCLLQNVRICFLAKT